MDDLDVFRDMLKDSVLIQIYEEYDKKCAKLVEQSTDGVKYEIVIRHIPDNTLIIKIDDFPAPSNIFNGTRGECKRADYAIINTDDKTILYVEMKKTSDSWHEIVKQLKGAKCAMTYLQEIAHEFWDSYKLLSGYTSWYVVVGHIDKATKRTSRTTNQKGRHNSPDNALKITYPPKNTIFYKQLFCEK